MVKKHELLYSQLFTLTLPKYVILAIEKRNEETNMPKARIVQNALIEYLKIDKPTSNTQVQVN